jgi:hypothetical protein
VSLNTIYCLIIQLCDKLYFLKNKRKGEHCKQFIWMTEQIDSINKQWTTKEEDWLHSLVTAVAKLV